MEYINKSKMDVQISVPNSNPVEWIVVKMGEKKDLPISERRAALNGLYTEAKLAAMTKEREVEEKEKVKAEESSIGHVKVETKKIEDPSKIKLPEFEKELTNIKGIGAKTAWDIAKVFKSKEDLIKAIKSKKGLPFRDDVVELLKKHYN